MEGLCKTTRRFRAVSQREAGAGFGEGTPQQGADHVTEIFKNWKFVATGRYLLSSFPCNTENSSERTAQHTDEKANPMCKAHQSPLLWSPFTPNAVPAPVLQRRISLARCFQGRSWHSIAIRTAYEGIKVRV